jgi:hypothetical protein
MSHCTLHTESSKVRFKRQLPKIVNLPSAFMLRPRARVWKVQTRSPDPCRLFWIEHVAAC